MRRVAGLAAIVGLAFTGTDVAYAGEQRSRADAQSDGGRAEVSAGIETVREGGGAGSSRHRGSGSSMRCRYHATDAARVVTADPGEAVAPEPREYYVFICTRNGQEVVNELRQYNPSEQGQPVVAPEVLAEQAAANLSVASPVVELSPKVGLNQITQLTTWMWVTNWEPDSASASVPGVTSTVTATPTKVTWNMGNGDEVVCNGPGTPFDFSRPEEGQSTDCSYTYRHSSTSQPGGVYEVSATMSYDVSWSAEGASGGGALPAVSATETFPVRVIEIHAVEGVGTGAG